MDLFVWRLLPSVVVDVFRHPFVFGGVLALWVSDADTGHGDDVGREVEHAGELFGALGDGVDAAPYGSEFHSVGCEQEIFGGCA